MKFKSKTKPKSVLLEPLKEYLMKAIIEDCAMTVEEILENNLTQENVGKWTNPKIWGRAIRDEHGEMIEDEVQDFAESLIFTLEHNNNKDSSLRDFIDSRAEEIYEWQTNISNPIVEEKMLQLGMKLQ